MFKWIRDIFNKNARSRPEPKRRPLHSPLCLEPLEDRELLNADVLIWKPAGVNLLASNPANWYDQTQGKSGVEAAGIGNGVGCTVWLDDSTSDTPITWDQTGNQWEIHGPE